MYDAGTVTDPAHLGGLREFLGPRVRALRTGGRILVLARPPAEATAPGAMIARRALTGFVRSLGKEVGRGGTVSLVRVADGAEASLAGTLRFLLSPRSAYVSGQVIDVARPVGTGTVADPARPHAGRQARA